MRDIAGTKDVRIRRPSAPATPSGRSARPKQTLSSPWQDRHLVTGLAFIALFNAAFAAILGFHPIAHSTIVTIDDLLCVAAPLAMVIWFFVVRAVRSRALTVAGARRWTLRPSLAPTLLAVGVLWYAVGSAIWAYYELVIHQPPFPSWADGGYLLSYPFFLCGILALPGRRLTSLQRVRVILDSLLIVTSAFIFSWIVILGPTVLQSSGGSFAQAVAVAYPVCDLILVLSLLLLFGRSKETTSWPVGILLGVGLTAIVCADSSFDYQNLHGGYVTGSLSDVAYTIGYMLVALGAIVAQRGLREGIAEEPLAASRPAPISSTRAGFLSLLPTFIPYLAVIVAAGAIVYVADLGTVEYLDPVLYVSSGALILLAMTRQIVVLVENQQARRARESAELSQRASEKRFRAVFDQAAVGVAQSDLDGRWVLANERLVELYGYRREELCDMRFVDITHPDDLKLDVAEYGRLRTGEIPSYTLEKRFIRKDGSTLWAEMTVSLVRDDAGEPQYTMAFVSDIGARKQAEDAIRHQALHDPLTDLPNRSLLEDRLNQALALTKRTDKPAALFVVDLNGFKEINDTYGHEIGDRVVQEVSSRLKSGLRSSDTVARLGGDEFAIVLPETDSAGSLRAVTKLINQFEVPIEVQGIRVHVSASVGIALFPDHAADGDELLRHADVAMYAAKRMKSEYTIYNADQDSYNPERLALANDLREAIEHDRLQVHYQPKLHLSSGRIDGVEALVRWNHPVQGWIPADQIIALAESAGLIKQLTLRVLSQALRQSAVWHAAGLDLRVAVNLSAQSLHDEHLAAEIIQMPGKYGCAPEWLELEITETGVMADAERALEMLRDLHAMGILISVDDFGTGYSSLSYLRNLPVDTIKIDRSFVMNMTDNPDDVSIVRSIVDLGHNLGMKVLAEGVEDASALQILEGLGCDLVQGYHLSRPLPSKEVAPWLEASGRTAQTVTGDPKLVLVVDDDSTYLKLLRALLASEGYEVVTASSPDQALETLKQVKPDLALVDVGLGEASGLELARQIKDDPRTRDLPIVAMSADSTVDSWALARAAGCDTFAGKPSSTGEILSLVNGSLPA
jgi:diguanylate cyclase (GGDEF)-like protein/PAS domain S-box-containing protein